MAKRDLTLAEIQAKLEELRNKVSEEGTELYNEIKDKVSELTFAASEKYDEAIEELGPKLEALKTKVTVEGGEILDELKEKFNKLYDEVHEELNEFHEEVQEEIEELKEVGLKAWIKSNPATAIGTVIVVGGIIALIAYALFGGSPTV